jgi:3-hydroxybutyryl-CoA dehydrogenase
MGVSSDADRIVSANYEDDLAQLKDCDLIIEAIAERMDWKRDLYAKIAPHVGAHTLLASNTSGLSITALSDALPEALRTRFCGIHFFNPVPVLRLVELVASLLTSEDTINRSTAFAEIALHKRVIRSKDRAGFIVNALLIPYILSAVRMLESGYASAEDIDLGMVEGCAHPMGPLRLADLIGLDTTSAVAESLYTEFKEPLYAAPPLLSRMVDAGLLGRKAGRGFYDYSKK